MEQSTGSTPFDHIEKFTAKDLKKVFSVVLFYLSFGGQQWICSHKQTKD
jgi:hypothetical protein